MTMSDSAYPRSSVAALAAFVFVAFGVQLYSMSVMLTEEAAGGVFSISVLSAAFGGSVVIAGLLAPRVGRWADDHSVRGLMAVGSILGASGLLIMASTDSSVVVVAAFWLLLGPAQAMTLYEPALVAVGIWVGNHHRNKAISLLLLIGGFAGPVFLPLSGFSVEAIGWRQTVVWLSLLLLATGVVVSLFLVPKVKPITHRTEPLPKVKWARFLHDRRLTFVTIAVVLLFASMSSMLFHRVAVFEEQGFDVGQVALLAGVSGLLTFPGRFFAPRMSNYLRPTTLFTLSSIGLVGSMVLAIVGSPAWVMVAHFVFFGIFFGFSLPMRAVIMNDWYAGHDYGSVMGKQWAIAAVAGGLAPWLVGVVRDATGSYAWPLVFVTLAVALSAVANALSASHHDSLTQASGNAELDA
jgi:MFS family permease